MNGDSKLDPSEDFPADLDGLPADEVSVLNSKVHRQMDAEYVEDGSLDPETEGRNEELRRELDDRDEKSGEAERRQDRGEHKA
ncbi:hypothetical protein [Arthrobacter zhaoguopingii]|uniref:hypothetical protein n=1 Tax=Arthrobacter zhaoguopingii TaxID=2681491 RepID=UPI001357D0E9|nr:hypothetical protein [Arthrobacter zhaoguopingii]